MVDTGENRPYPWSVDNQDEIRRGWIAAAGRSYKLDWTQQLRAWAGRTSR
jgi:hypothetical protein